MTNGTHFHLQNVIQYVSAVFSLAINTFLIVLIATKSPKQLGAYKYLMMCISIHEIGYSILDFIVSPIFHSYGSTFLIIVITKHHILLTASQIPSLYSVYSGFIAFSLAMFALHFVYRYLVISGNKRLLATFNSWKFFLWLGGPLSYGVTWSLMNHYFFLSTKGITKRVQSNVLEVYDLKTDDYILITASFHEPTDEKGDSFGILQIIGIITMLFFVTSAFVIAVVFGTKCYFRVNSLVRHSSSSGRAHKLQRQLLYALVTQTLIPIILMHCPIGVLFLCALLSWNIGSLSAIVSIAISLYPAIDPLPTIFMVRHYRKGVMEWLRVLRSMATKKFLFDE